ncbi:hypothetical protein [Paenibacillus massiliensis]|uniref:hypothetical protein n=1 Tax=Paenibacillus massiliensis TaxID=225917 RepID=UPI0004007FFB|nr:hypothetical protein [Paenibacillus massiliensis]
MLNSSYRHRAVSGWLKENHPIQFNSDLKLQKFLFFYEAQCETEDGSAHFNSLKGYKNGPVFSDVFGDFKYDYHEFDENVTRLFHDCPEHVDIPKAKLASFLVRTMTEDELSILTHEFNIWKAKEHRILQNEKNVPLSRNDFNENDKSLINSFCESYTEEFIDSIVVLEVLGKSFVIEKSDYSILSDDQRLVFLQLAQQEELVNPVYITISEDGVILVD